jgi:hypothetical protein
MAGFLVLGDVLVITGSGSNNGTYHVTDGGHAGYCVVEETLANESVGNAVTITGPVHVTFGDYSLLTRGLAIFWFWCLARW